MCGSGFPPGPAALAAALAAGVAPVAARAEAVVAAPRRRRRVRLRGRRPRHAEARARRARRRVPHRALLALRARAGAALLVVGVRRRHHLDRLLLHLALRVLDGADARLEREEPLVALLRDALLELVALLRRHLVRRRHVKRGDGRDDPVAHPEIDHRGAPRRLVHHLVEPRLGPPAPQIAAVLDALHRERFRDVAARPRERHAREAPRRRHAAHDEERLVRDLRAQITREDALHAAAEIHLGAEPHGSLRVFEEPQRRARRRVRVPDALREGAAREPREERHVRAVAHAEPEEPHGPRQLGEPLPQIQERQLAHRRRPVADVDDGAAARRIQRFGCGAEHRAEVRRAAAGELREPRQDRPPRLLVDSRELVLARHHGPQPHVAGPHDGAIFLAEVREERRHLRARERELRSVRRRRRVDHDSEIQPARRERHVARAHRHDHVVGLRLRALDRALPLLRRQRVEIHSVLRRVRHLPHRPVVEQLDGEIRPRHHVVIAHHEEAVLARRGHPRAHVLGTGARQVDEDRQLLDRGQRAVRALRGHRVNVHAPLAPGPCAAEPLRVPHHNAPRLTGPDRVEARLVRAGALPLEQRGIFLRSGVHVRLVLLRRRLLLLHAAPRDRAAAVHAEPVQRRAVRRAEPVDALDGLRRRVEEHLVDLGRREVPVDRHLHVEPLDREREPRRPGAPRGARAHGPDAVRRRLRRPIRRREAARPVVPRHDRLGRRLHLGALALQRQQLARARARHVPRAHLAREDVGRRGARRGHVDARAHPRELHGPARRHDLRRLLPRRVDEELALRHLQRRRPQRQLRGPADQERRARVPPDPRDALRADRHRLPVHEPLPRIGRARLAVRELNRHAAPDDAKLGPRLRLRRERRAGALASAKHEDREEDDDPEGGSRGDARTHVRHRQSLVESGRGAAVHRVAYGRSQTGFVGEWSWLREKVLSPYRGRTLPGRRGVGGSSRLTPRTRGSRMRGLRRAGTPSCARRPIGADPARSCARSSPRSRGSA